MAETPIDHSSEHSDNREATDGTGNARLETRQFQRAYKACLHCRKRKSRCELTAEDHYAGRPCERCRRERRECVFASERPAPKRPRPRTADDDQRHSRAQRRWNPQSAPDGNRNDSRSSIFEDTYSAPLNGRRSEYKNSEAPARNEQSRGTVLAQRETSPLPPINDLADSVMRTVVYNGKDALNLLFVAAHQHDGSETHQSPHSNLNSIGHVPVEGNISQTTPGSRFSVDTPNYSLYSVGLPNVSSGVLEVWNACRFVKMGWFTAEEAVIYIDLFYQNLSPLSPILTNFFQSHSNHYLLVTQEPLLCCVILTISSRYHNLPGTGGVSRGYLIHERLWDHCQHIILRVVLGQEKSSKAKTRTLGSIEALLLLTEWHPRALHFPPPNDGWDSDLLLTAVNARDEIAENTETTSRGRWLEDVINPAKRSDRMSWMLIGNALSLAYELGVFDRRETKGHKDKRAHLPGESRRVQQRLRLQKLLFLYIEQSSSRLGCESILPQSLSHIVLPSPSSTTSAHESPSSWRHFMAAWIELTKLTKSMSDTLFPSPTFTDHLLHCGRYINLIQHFEPLLSAWNEKHLNISNLTTNFYNVLYIEYHHARIFMNSLGLQAVVERTLAETESQTNRGKANISIDSTDYGFIQEVVDGSLEILQKAVELGETNALMYSPVRIYLRITTASVFLLKGLGLGVSSTKLRTSIDHLTRCIATLRSSALDDIHLGSRYATLLENHVSRLKDNFIRSARPPSFATRPPSVEYGTALEIATSGAIAPSDAASGALDLNSDSLDESAIGQPEDWLTLPFDASLNPYVSGDTQGLNWLGDGTLDFIWNLEAS